MEAGNAQELDARPILHVRGVDHRQPGTAKSHLEQPMEELERVVGGALRRGVVGDEGAHRIRREDLGRREVASGERRLA